MKPPHLSPNQLEAKPTYLDEFFDLLTIVKQPFLTALDEFL